MLGGCQCAEARLAASTFTGTSCRVSKMGNQVQSKHFVRAERWGGKNVNSVASRVPSLPEPLFAHLQGGACDPGPGSWACGQGSGGGLFFSLHFGNVKCLAREGNPSKQGGGETKATR